MNADNNKYNWSSTGLKQHLYSHLQTRDILYSISWEPPLELRVDTTSMGIGLVRSLIDVWGRGKGYM